MWRAFRSRYGLTAAGSAERRVAALALAITLMGLADLALTLTYMRTTGMYELNPVARMMVATGGTPQLIVFKLLTLSCSAGLLYLLRRRPVAEPTAWCCALVMGLLSVHWMLYTNSIANPEVWHGMQLAMADGMFVKIDGP